MNITVSGPVMEDELASAIVAGEQAVALAAVTIEPDKDGYAIVMRFPYVTRDVAESVLHSMREDYE